MVSSYLDADQYHRLDSFLCNELFYFRYTHPKSRFREWTMSKPLRQSGKGF